MNNISRCTRFRVATLIVLTIFGSHAPGLRAAASLEQTPVSPWINLRAVPKPVRGQSYRFSLCTGELLAPDAVSSTCMPDDAALTVGGAAPNTAVVFRLQTGSFLPPGFILDGNGVIRGAAGADPTKLKEIKVCAIQTGPIGTNFNCQGQPIKFANKVEFAKNPTPAGGGAGSNVGKIVAYTALMGGVLATTAYAVSQVEPIDLGNVTGSSTTTTPTNNNPAPVSNTPSTVGLGTFTCSVANDTSGFRSCTGSVNIRAGTLLAARQGQSLSVVVAPSAFVGTFIAPALGGTTGTVSLRATLPRTCPTQVLIAFSPDGNSVIESLAVSIPVSCP
jgi:hypothetical protein